jgi:hypothetical protein
MKRPKMPQKRHLTPAAVEQRRQAGASWSQTRRKAQAERMRLAHRLAREAKAPLPSP